MPCVSRYGASAQKLTNTLELQYQKYKPGSIQRMMITGKYAQALFFNKQEDKAFAVLNENIAYAKRETDGKYAAYLYTVAAINYKLLIMLKPVKMLPNLLSSMCQNKRSGNKRECSLWNGLDLYAY
jgi:hypothetical protein